MSLKLEVAEFNILIDLIAGHAVLAGHGCPKRVIKGGPSTLFQLLGALQPVIIITSTSICQIRFDNPIRES